MFKISRGVLQGDILSPLFFILTLEYILRMHDTTHSKGVNLGGSRIHTLGYADDLALTDNGNATGRNPIASTSERTTSIAAVSRERADMKVKITKTKVMYVRAQDPGGVGHFKGRGFRYM